MPPLRYVILWHEGVREPHFDLMFETLPGSALSTWRSPAWPIERPTSLTRLREHRPGYLHFEGEVSGSRGTVQRVTAGTCEVEVGEASAWTVRLLTGATPCSLMLRLIDGDYWEAIPF